MFRGFTCHSSLHFATLRDETNPKMNQKPPSPIVLARKKREAAALKANLKRRKEQGKASAAQAQTKQGQ